MPSCRPVIVLYTSYRSRTRRRYPRSVTKHAGNACSFNSHSGSLLLPLRRNFVFSLLLFFGGQLDIETYLSFRRLHVNRLILGPTPQALPNISRLCVQKMTCILQ